VTPVTPVASLPLPDPVTVRLFKVLEEPEGFVTLTSSTGTSVEPRRAVAPEGEEGPTDTCSTKGVAVEVAVELDVAEEVKVGVEVEVEVCVRVNTGVDVEVGVAVKVEVEVWVELKVEVAVGVRVTEEVAVKVPLLVKVGVTVKVFVG